MSALCMIDEAPATEGNLCSGCSGYFREMVRRAPGQLVDVDDTTAKQCQQTAGERGGSSSERALVYNVAASEVGGEFRAALRGLAHVADERSVWRFEESDAQLVARVLGGWSAVCRSEGVVALLERLSLAVEAALSVVNSAPSRRVVGVCDCGAQLVTAQEAGDLTCRRCEAVWSIEEWDAYRVSMVQTRVVSGPTITGLWRREFGRSLSEARLRQWVRRGKLGRVCDLETREEGLVVREVVAVWESMYGPLRGRRANGPDSVISA